MSCANAKSVRLLKRLNEERSQLILMFVGIFSVVMAIGAITIDFGLWFSERQGVERAADLAALAGSQSLLRHVGQPDVPGPGPGGWVAGPKADQAQAISDACLWAQRNGYQDGQDGVEVYAQLLCRPNTDPSLPQAGLCLNTGTEPIACGYQHLQSCAAVLSYTPQVTDDNCDTIQVTVNKPATQLFSSFFHVGGTQEGFGSAAGDYVQAKPLDAVLVMDDTGTMSGTPIAQAKLAATNFTNYLLPTPTPPPGTSTNQVGFTPFRGCYNPTANINPLSESDPNRGCVKLTDTISLSNSPNAVDAGINRLQAPGGFPGTNVCLGLFRGGTILNGPGSQTGARKALVILTDGDNSYTDYAQADVAALNPPSLPTAGRHLANPVPNTYPLSITDSNGTPTDGSGVCRPAGPNLNSTYPSPLYDARINNLDSLTLAEADALKAQGVEIYVVSFGNTSTDDGTNCTRGLVGTGSNRQNHENYDRNLAKCIASSKTGTNDHYYETDVSGFMKTFQAIAWAITGRSLTQ